MHLKFIIIISLVLSPLLEFFPAETREIQCNHTIQEKNDIRELFFKASYDEQAFYQLKYCLTPTLFDDDSKFVAYQGAIEVLSARYNGGPMKKVHYVTQGKQQINDALEIAPEDIEIRFLRFAVAYHLPGLLRNKAHYSADKKFIYQHIKEIKSLNLSFSFKHKLYSFLKETNCYSQTELTTVKSTIFILSEQPA